MLKNDAQLKQKKWQTTKKNTITQIYLKKIMSKKIITSKQKKKRKKKKKKEEATSSGKQKANIYNWKKIKIRASTSPWATCT